MREVPTITREEFYRLLPELIQRIETQHNARATKTLNDMGKAAGRPGYEKVGYDDAGTRFVRVWRDSGQKGVAVFVEKDTGVIFGAKGWKAYNPNNEYGTLMTLDEWDWSGYYAVHKQGKKSLVPKADRR